MFWDQSVQYAALSDIGFRRRMNQDAYVVQLCADRALWRTHGHMFMVADGMGGHAVGELASKIAVDTVPHTFFKSRGVGVRAAVKSAVEAANAAIHRRGSSEQDFQRMGTTGSVLVLSSEGAVIGHVGDSRIYRVRGETISQLTFDHSLQWELIRQGRMKPEEVYLNQPRHVITRSLGPETRVEVDVEGPYPVLPGDTFVLCSDGLTGHLADSEIGMAACELPPAEACRFMVNLANLRGGSDNITVIVARVGELPPRAARGDDEPHREGRSGWSWAGLAAFWTMGLAIALGISMMLFGRLVEGLLIAAGGLVGTIGLLLWGWKRWRHAPPQVEEGDVTRLWRPYRTASARLTRKFLNHIASLESELQRSASDEKWPIDWSRHEASYGRAQHAIAEKRYGEALAEYGHAIDALMAGVSESRR
ncbi:MAG: protein phosphatase 2C domain-containing protein [Planctomycetaceae bacterium]